MSPALGRMLLRQKSKQYSNLCWMVEAGKKISQRSGAAAEGSWGSACPITLLCKGSCCIIKTLNPCDFHMSGPQVWPGMLRAAHRRSKGSRFVAPLKKINKEKKIKNSLSQKRGPPGSEQQDCSRVFTGKGEPNSWGRSCRNTRGGTHPSAVTPLRYRFHHVRRGQGVVVKFESRQGGILEII